MSSNEWIEIYLREIKETKLSVRESEGDLVQQIIDGNPNARTKLLLSNLWLVVHIARDYQGRGLLLLDLISAGNAGLSRAAERFNPDRWVKFSTYASWRIKWCINLAIENGWRDIRVSRNMHGKIAWLRRCIRILEQEFGRPLADDEIIDEIGISPEDLALIRSAQAHIPSLQDPLRSGGMLGDRVIDERVLDSHEALVRKERIKILRVLLDELGPRDREIMEARLFPDGDQPTQEELGKRFTINLSPKTVSLIERTLVVRLRERLKQLEDVPLVRKVSVQRAPGKSQSDVLQDQKIIETTMHFSNGIPKKGIISLDIRHRVINTTTVQELRQFLLDHYATEENSTTISHVTPQRFVDVVESITDGMERALILRRFFHTQDKRSSHRDLQSEFCASYSYMRRVERELLTRIMKELTCVTG